MSKRDYLQDCMRDLGPNPLPLPEFSAAFCSRCLQFECTRSISGSSLFEQRVQNWEERLFKSPSSLSKDDERYAGISTQKFVEVPTAHHLPILGQGSPSVTSSAWIDPLETPEPVKIAPKKTKPRPVKTVETKEAPSEEAPSEEEPQKKAKKKTSKKKSPRKRPTPEKTQVDKSQEAPALKPHAAPQVVPANTPFQQGVMIDPPSPVPVSTPKDPWDSPAKPAVEEGTTVLKPGTKFRFGK